MKRYRGHSHLRVVTRPSPFTDNNSNDDVSFRSTGHDFAYTSIYVCTCAYNVARLYAAGDRAAALMDIEFLVARSVPRRPISYTSRRNAAAAEQRRTETVFVSRPRGLKKKNVSLIFFVRNFSRIWTCKFFNGGNLNVYNLSITMYYLILFILNNVRKYLCTYVFVDNSCK